MVHSLCRSTIAHPSSRTLLLVARLCAVRPIPRRFEYSPHRLVLAHLAGHGARISKTAPDLLSLIPLADYGPTTCAHQPERLVPRACRGEILPRVPVWLMRQAGRYLPEYREIRAKHAFLEVCKTPQLAVEVSIQPLRRLGVDAVIVFSDILIPAEAMGLQLELGDAGPNLPNPVRSKLDVDRLQMFDPEAETGFLPETIRRIVKSVGPEVPVLGFAGAPWTLACYMVEGKTKEGFATVKSFLYHEPKTFRELLHRIAQATIPYLKAQIAAGATAVQLFDTWCGELNLQRSEERRVGKECRSRWS